MVFDRLRIPRWRVCLAGGLVLFTCTFDREAPAQSPAAGAPGNVVANANEVTNFKGTLKGIQRGVLSVTREDGTDVLVQPPDEISGFTFVATAKPAFLQRGQMVRFSGAFGPTGIAVAPIDKVEIFQPVPAQRLKGHAREQFLPGVYPADRRAVKQPAAMAKYNVVGALMGVNAAGVMVVQAGKTSLQVPLAQDVTFELRYNNLNLAQEGDPVSVAGFFQPPDDTKVKAERITITPDRIYGEPTEQPPQRRPRSRREEAKEKAAAAKAEAERAAAGEAAGEDAAAGDGAAEKAVDNAAEANQQAAAEAE
jgi:hypothetical protein